LNILQSSNLFLFLKNLHFCKLFVTSNFAILPRYILAPEGVPDSRQTFTYLSKHPAFSLVRFWLSRFLTQVKDSRPSLHERAGDDALLHRRCSRWIFNNHLQLASFSPEVAYREFPLLEASTRIIYKIIKRLRVDSTGLRFALNNESANVNVVSKKI